MKYVQETFTLNEIITISNILNIPCKGNKTKISRNILSLLTDINQLDKNANDASSDTDASESEYKINKNKERNAFSMQTNNIGKKSNSENLINYACSDKSNVIHNSINLNYANFESTLVQFNTEPH